MNKDVTCLRAVEVAAIASHKYIGKKDKNAIDQAAVEAMSIILNDNNGFQIKVINGEGELDNAPMLYSGQVFGDEKNSKDIYDMSVDPIEGTNPAAYNFAGSISTIAISRKNTMLKLPEMYMEKLFVSNIFKDQLDFSKGIIACIKQMQKVKKTDDLKCIILDKERHNKIIDEFDKLGILVRLIKDGDVLAAIDVVNGEADFVYGIGGAPEGSLMAALAISSNCQMFAKLVSYDEVWKNEPETVERVNKENAWFEKYNIDKTKIFNDTDLIDDPRVRFFASGVTAGGTLKPIDYINGKFYVNSLMSSHGIVRTIKSIYDMKNVNSLNPKIKFIFDKYKRNEK